MKITEFLKENLVILDGGMGTLLQGSGLQACRWESRAIRAKIQKDRLSQ